MTVYKQERPAFCPHPTCLFKRRVMEDMCVGNLPEPVPHDADFNVYRWCLNGADKDGGVFDLQVNNTDLEWFRWLFDALDGKATSWLSKKAASGTGATVAPSALTAEGPVPARADAQTRSRWAHTPKTQGDEG